MSQEAPDPFLEVRVHDVATAPGLTGLCVGYECGEWRAERLSQHILEWLPEFALSRSEYESIRGYNALPLIRKAARQLYTSDKYAKRGEFGELLLHIAIRQVFGSMPAVSKIFYKSAANETVKGFDAVHVVAINGGLELWLGEVKFYQNLNGAIRDVVAELREHTRRNYLRDEFLLIANKLDPNWKHSAEIRALMNQNKSLDEVFNAVCIPVMLTYDSDAVGTHDKCDASYLAAFEKEVRLAHKDFAGRDLPDQVRIHLFLMPLKAKKALVKAMHERMKVWR